MITNAQYTAWLAEQDAIRCILVEAVANVSGTETTHYFSSKNYVTSSTDTPANTDYLNIIKGGIKFTESLSLESNAKLSFGDVELENYNGIYDDMLDHVWVNRQIKVFIGDVQWQRSDFRLIFDGIIDDIDSKNNTSLNIKIRDKLQRLNTPVSDTKLGGLTINQDKLLPICLGECFNITPLLVDETTLEYQVHDGAIEDIIEVRDNGVPVSFTKNLANGKFTLDQNPSGAITCSVQGDKPSVYYNTVSKLVERLATGYGKLSERFTAADIDAANFSAFDTANPQPVGIYIDSRTNVLVAINQICASVGAQAVISSAGKLRLLKIDFPAVGTPVDITPVNMLENKLSVSDRLPVKSAIKLGFCKNWTVQNNLETGIPEEHKAFYYEQWVSRSSSDALIATKYKLDNEPKQKDTLLLDDGDAQTEAGRLLAIYSTPRITYTAECFTPLIESQLGDAATLTHSRFGLSAGKTGVIVKRQIDWFKFTVKLGVII